MHKPVPVEEQSPDRSLWWGGAWAPGGHPAWPCPGWDCCKQGSHQPWLCLPMAWQAATHSLSPLLCCLSKLLSAGGKLCSVVLSLTKTFSLSLIVLVEVLCFGRCLSHLLFSVAFVGSKEKYFNWSNRNASRTGQRCYQLLNLHSTCVLLAVPGNAVRSMGKLRGAGAERFEC